LLVNFLTHGVEYQALILCRLILFCTEDFHDDVDLPTGCALHRSVTLATAVADAIYCFGSNYVVYSATCDTVTARCYTERGYEIACGLSVRLSVTFRYLGWNASKII